MNPGLDKITLKNFEIESIDFDTLAKNSNVKIYYGKTGTYPVTMHDHGKPVRQIKIEDNEKFLDLIIGVKTVSYGKCIKYSSLTLCVAFRNGNNKESLSVSEYNDYLECILTYIEDIYGIAMRAGNDVTISYMEIAFTLPMCISKISFFHMVSLFMSFLPQTFKMDIRQDHNHPNKVDANPNYYHIMDAAKLPHQEKRGNNSSEFIIYIKSNLEAWMHSHDQSVTKPHEHLVRFEIRLLTYEKIESFLGTGFFFKMNDTLIQSSFHSFFNQKIRKKWEEWLISTQKHLSQLIQDARHTHRNYWMHYLVAEIDALSWQKGLPYIIDAKQLYDALPSNQELNRNKARMIKTLKRQIYEKGHLYWLYDDINLINGVFSALDKSLQAEKN